MKRYSNNNRNKNENNWPDSNMHANQQRQQPYNKQVGRYFKSNLDEKINQTVQKQSHKINDSILKTPVKNEKQKLHCMTDHQKQDTPARESPLDYSASGSSSAYDSDEENNNMKNTSSQSLNSTIECGGNTSCNNQTGNSSCGEQTELQNQQLPHPTGGNMMAMMMTPSSEHGIPYGYYSVPVGDYDYNNNMMQTNHVSTPYYHVYQSPYSQNGSTGPGPAPTTAIYYQYSPYMYDPSVIASPQSSSMLATAPSTAYQTPPPAAHHQLYVSSANPTGISPNDSYSPNSVQTSHSSAYCSASTASNSTTNMMTPCSSSMTSASCSATSVMPESSISATSAVMSNGESPSSASPSLHQMLSSTSLSSSSTAATAPYAVVYQTPMASTVHQSGYMMYQQAPMRNPYQTHTTSHVSYQATPTTTSSMQHVPVYAPNNQAMTPQSYYRDSNNRGRFNRNQNGKRGGQFDYYNKSQVMMDSTPQTLNFNQTIPGTPYMHQQAPTHYNQPESVDQASDDLNSTITSVTNNNNPLMETLQVQQQPPQAMYSPYDYSMVSPIYQDPSCMMATSSTGAALLPTQIGYNAYGMPVGPMTTPASAQSSPPLLPNYYASPAENGGFGTQFPLASAFACANEYDTYDENGNLVVEDFSKRRCFNFNDDEEIEDDGDEEKEQLACYVCRGRRMCFCYFLKVRYYKFPSFLDLVDHQYKKWKIGMQRARKAAAAATATTVAQ